MSKIIKISEGFSELLQKIKSSSTVANLILESSKEGHTLPVINNGIDYLSISEADSNKISYLNCDRINSIDEGNFWSSGKRYHILPGKIISKLFDKSIMDFITPKDVEIFSNVYRSSQVENKVKFEVVKGESIKHYYNYNTYNRNVHGDLCGSLGGSCMKHDRCQEYFSIYVDNKEISLLCLLDKNDNSLIGRALLWDIEAVDKNSEKKPFKIMDRIYTINDDFYTSMFKNWAINNNYYYKQEQSFSNSVWFEKDSKKIDLYLSVNLNINCKYFPYLDTFKFIDINNSVLYNYPIEGVQNLKILNSTEGYLNKATDYCFDEITRIVYHINDTTQLGYLDNIRVFHGNVFHSNVHDCYILKAHAQYDYALDDYIFNEEYDKFNDKTRIELILSERKKREEEHLKKRGILESLRSSNSSVDSMWDDELEPSEEEPIEPIEDTYFRGHSGLRTLLQAEGRVLRTNIPEESTAGIIQPENNIEEIRPRRRVPSSARRPPGITSPGINAVEYDTSAVPINNEADVMNPITTEYINTTDYNNSISNSTSSSINRFFEEWTTRIMPNTNRVYPNLSDQLIQQVSIGSQPASNNNEDTLEF